MTRSLQWRIALSMWLIAAICTVVAETVTVWILIKNNRVSIEQELQSTATTLISLGISDYHGLEKFQQLDSFIEDALHLARMNQVVRVFTKRGKLMFSTIPPSEEDFHSVMQPALKPSFSDYDGKTKKYRVLTLPYKANTGKDYYLQIAMSYPRFKDVINATKGEALTLFVFVSMLAFFISNFLTERLLAPVKAIAHYLNTLSLSETKEWRPLLLTRPGGYLKDIVVGINLLTVKIKSSLYGMSRLSRYLAHELRNPLTILSGEAQNVLAKQTASSEEYAKVLVSSLEEIQRMENVVSTVSKIFRGEKAAYQPIPCELGNWVESHIDTWRKMLGREIVWGRNSASGAPGAVRSASGRPAEPMQVVVDPDLLYRLIDNLIRNIKRHTPITSSCLIELGRNKEVVFISVEDFGGGMPTPLLEALNRGVMQDGIGIGLSLCLEIATVCKFKLNFFNKKEGGLQVLILVGESGEAKN